MHLDWGWGKYPGRCAAPVQAQKRHECDAADGWRRKHPPL